MPTETQLDLEQTFDAQKHIVNNNIVLTVMETLDLKTFPVSEGIVYEIIHNHHKHQCKEHLGMLTVRFGLFWSGLHQFAIWDQTANWNQSVLLDRGPIDRSYK